MANGILERAALLSDVIQMRTSQSFCADCGSWSRCVDRGPILLVNHGDCGECPYVRCWMAEERKRDEERQARFWLDLNATRLRLSLMAAAELDAWLGIAPYEQEMAA